MLILSYAELASEVKRDDERKSSSVFPIVTSIMFSGGGNFGRFLLRPKINTTKSIGGKSTLTLSDTNVYYTCIVIAIALPDLNVVILSDECGDGVRHRPLKRVCKSLKNHA
jgi:hypothetical protein